jgi:hypothetical protein
MTPERTPRTRSLAFQHPGPRRARYLREVPVAVGVFVVVLLSLQVFLLTVGLDALLTDNEGLAWVTAALSVLLAAGAAAFYRYLR